MNQMSGTEIAELIIESNQFPNFILGALGAQIARTGRFTAVDLKQTVEMARKLAIREDPK